MKIALIAALLALCGPDPVPQQPGIVVDAATKTIRVPCRIAPRKLANLPDIYPCEVVATWPAPKGGKAHETVVNFDIMPSEVHKALESLGLKPGHPGRGEDPVAAGPECEVLLEIPGANKAPPRVLPIESGSQPPMRSTSKGAYFIFSRLAMTAWIPSEFRPGTTPRRSNNDPSFITKASNSSVRRSSSSLARSPNRRMAPLRSPPCGVSAINSILSKDLPSSLRK